MNKQKRIFSQIFSISLIIMIIVFLARGALTFITGEYNGSAPRTGSYKIEGDAALFMGAANVFFAWVIASILALHLKFNKRIGFIMLFIGFGGALFCLLGSILRNL